MHIVALNPSYSQAPSSRPNTTAPVTASPPTAVQKGGGAHPSRPAVACAVGKSPSHSLPSSRGSLDVVARPGIVASGSPVPIHIQLERKVADMAALQAEVLAIQAKQKLKQNRQSCSSESSHQQVRKQQLLQQLCCEAITASRLKGETSQCTQRSAVQYAVPALMVCSTLAYYERHSQGACPAIGYC